MTTPSANTPYAIIEQALFEAKILQEGQPPNGEQLVRGMARLTDLVNLEATQGLKLFLQEDLEIVLVSGTQTYSITINSLKPMRVQQGYYLDSTGSIRRPIYPLSWQEWLTLSNISTEGEISQYFVNKQATTLNVSFWYIPDDTAAEGTAHLLTQRQVSPPISLTTDTVFPIEWRTFLVWKLAQMSSNGQPKAISEFCTMMAEQARIMLEDWDVEDAPTNLQVDSRYGPYSQFR